MIKIAGRLSISEDELKFTASRSSGPGGQNVNKVNTRVTLHFQVTHSPSLSSVQKQRILRHLATRINREGVLRVASQRYRSQAANREAAIERFVELIQDSLKTVEKRKQTKIPQGAKKRRIGQKRQRGRLKQDRSKRFSQDDET